MSITNGMLKINDLVLPYPERELEILRQQLVDSSRNAAGQVVSQMIGGRLVKISSLTWKYLTADQWHEILVEIKKFEGLLTFYDLAEDDFITVRVYWGDASEKIHSINPATGEILTVMDCKCNIIDMGYPYV